MRKTLWRVLVFLLLAAVAAYTILALRSRPAPEHPFFAGQTGLMSIAHQGGEQLRPSNTLAAFAHAADLGVDVLEMDIHATSDGVLVVMHDDTVDRTTDGSGAIKEMTLAEIQQLDAGYYWTDDGGQTYPYRGQGIRVPALAEVFAAFPDWRMNIEIKQTEPSIVPAFCQLLRQHGLAEQVLVGSFHEEAILEMRQTCPEVATSVSESEARAFWILNALWLGALYQPPAEAIQVPERSTLPVLGEVQVITPRLLRVAGRHNMAVHVWTVNETPDMQRLIALGVDGIITDRPDRLLALPLR